MVVIAMQVVTIQKDHTTAPTNQEFMGMTIIAAKVTTYLENFKKFPPCIPIPYCR